MHRRTNSTGPIGQASSGFQRMLARAATLIRLRPSTLSARHRGTNSSAFAGLAALTVVATVGATIFTGSLLTAAPAEANAPGSPGTSSAPTLVYQEDFQNGSVPTAVQRLTQYTGATGQKYTAAQVWLSACNGWIASASQSVSSAAQIADCAGSQNSWNQSQRLAQSLGMLNGQTAAQARSNYADTAYTAGDPGVGAIEFQTATNIPFVAANRFITFGVDVAAENCYASAPLLQFYLLNAAGTATPSGGVINSCQSGREITVPALGAAGSGLVRVGHYTANGAVLFTGASVGIRMTNNNGSGAGNDHTIDNLKILDVTPQLDKSFSPAIAHVGDTSKLTFTVTNTTELGSKNGWSFNDSLPVGLTLASPTGAASTCGAPTITAPAGGTVVSVKGNLNVGMASCTVSVNVTSQIAGSYTNAPTANVTTTGLDLPSAATVQFVAPQLQVTKTADKTAVVAGDTVTYSVKVTNPSAAAFTLAKPASFTDDLSAVLDDATYNNNATGGATYQAPTLSWSGALAAGATTTITYSVRVNSPDTGDQTLKNTVVTPASVGGNCSAGATDPACTVTLQRIGYTVAKTASSGSVVEGDSIAYTVTVTNTGGIAYTAQNPASFSDDLSKVLDDATYNGDASTGAAVSGTTLTWSGALAVGATSTVTYSVKVNTPDTGDKKIINAVAATGTGGSCTTAAACTTTTNVRSFTVTKTANMADVVPGSTVVYTVTVKNTGTQAYTAANPASFSDDLSKVTDDATYNNNATGGATYSSPVISWSGALAVGASTTITYSVTVKNPDTGDHHIDNTVVTPPLSGGNCAAGSADPACTVLLPAGNYTVAKTASVSKASPGDTVTYSVKVTNTGATAFTAAAPASFTDDLSKVLDDATYNKDASGGATVTGSTLSWSGALAIGASTTITYSVKVNTPDTGDRTLTNSVVPTSPGGACDPDGSCVTKTPVASYTVAKTASASTVNPGDTITYTVTVINTGTSDYTAASPASFTDDLTKVTDDATYSKDATGGATLTGNTLTWSGALAAGARTVVTYSVKVNTPDTGDKTVTNAVVASAKGGSCATVGGCSTTTNVASYTVSKAASASTVSAGDKITYTVSVTNTGTAAYTAAAPARFTDDLSKVIDDATYNNDASGGATFATPAISWAGALAVGATATVTYSVTVNSPDTGDKKITNTVVASGAGGSCATAASCTTTTNVRSYTVTKTADKSTVVAGSVVTYTVTVKNTGTAAYTAAIPASFTDDLSKVTDDATYNNDATGGATYTAPTLSWSGALAIGATATITYSVTVNTPDAGDHHLDNTVVTPAGNGGNCAAGSTDPACSANLTSASYTVSKKASASTVNPGDTITYTVTVVNTGAIAYTAASPASFTDNLSKVTDDAKYNSDATGGAIYTAPTLSWSGALAVGATTTVTYSVTVNTPDTGDKTVTNAVTASGPGGSCTTAAACTTTTAVASYSVKKTASSAIANPGDTITYTVAVTNTGTSAYTAAAPASFTDDLSKVTDDAKYNGDATNGAKYAAPTLSWSGALAVGAVQTVTYTVTVNTPDAGDRSLTNTAVPSGPGGSCTTAADCTTNTAIASYTVSKKASSATANPGDVITYTVSVVNTGTAAYTVASPASFTDDLSKVTDDATYNRDATNGATVSADTLTWSGALGVGETQTVTYSVTVNTPDAGDKKVTNAVVASAPGGSCLTAADCTTTTNVRSFTVVKTASDSMAHPGDTVTYTVTVANTGTADYTAQVPASFADDLSAVLDDSTYNADATGGAVYSAPLLSWSSALAVGQSATVAYSVKINDPDTGDSILTNAVVPTAPGGNCATAGDCTTTTDTQSYSLAKTASGATTVPGAVVTYTVVVKNTGSAAYTATDPASFTDDLSEVTDDATYNGDVTGGATYAAPTIAWSGALAVGESHTVSYTVTVDSPDLGDHVLKNTAVAPVGSGGGCVAGSTDADCSTSTPVAAYTVAKTASITTANVGDTITYTVTVTNTGAAAYGPLAQASFTDDLSQVTDDATYNGDATSGATVTGDTLSWSGVLAIGEVVKVTYSVTVNTPDTGDKNVANAVMATSPGGSCEVVGGCSTNTNVRSFAVKKTADTNTVTAGQKITYTVTVTNTGTAAYTAAIPANFTDDLSKVLDDATYNSDATGGATYAAPTLSWSGALAVGATETITYSVKVNTPDTGDKRLLNAVTTGNGGNCGMSTTDPACSVTIPSSSYTVAKTASTTTTMPGAKVLYTITVVNTGQGAYTAAVPASFTDNLADVLDDATYNKDATAGAVLTGSTLTWAGALAVGEAKTITYSVTVNDPDTGNQKIVNAVDPTAPGGICITDTGCTTTTAVLSPVLLAFTGVNPVGSFMLAAGLLLMGLLATIATMIRRRQRKFASIASRVTAE